MNIPLGPIRFHARWRPCRRLLRRTVTSSNRCLREPEGWFLEPRRSGHIGADLGACLPPLTRSRGRYPVAAEATDGLTWADVVGRDGIEPPTLRFSTECGTSRSVRHGSPESHPP